MENIQEGISEDEKLWTKLASLVPFSVTPSNSRDEAMRKPGCCVKSKERDLYSPRKYFGVVAIFGIQAGVAKEVVVVSHRSTPGRPRFVWSGTKTEYFELWDCD